MIKIFENPDVPSFVMKPEINISITGNRTDKSMKKKKTKFIRDQYSLFYEFYESSSIDYEIKIADGINTSEN